MKNTISPKIPLFRNVQYLAKGACDFDLAKNCDLKDKVGTFGLKTGLLFSFPF